ARLAHPGIVQIYEIGEHAGEPFFSLEYCGGGSLDCHLAGQALPPRVAARLVETLARAVQHAHEHAIVHRDLKPANGMLQKTDFTAENAETAERKKKPSSSLPSAVSALSAVNPLIPKITDFGLAKKLDADEGQTRAGAVIGTPAYMAPEQ